MNKKPRKSDIIALIPLEKLRELVASGLTDREIAGQFGLLTATIERYRLRNKMFRADYGTQSAKPHQYRRKFEPETKSMQGVFFEDDPEACKPEPGKPISGYLSVRAEQQSSMLFDGPRTTLILTGNGRWRM